MVRNLLSFAALSIQDRQREVMWRQAMLERVKEIIPTPADGCYVS